MTLATHTHTQPDLEPSSPLTSYTLLNTTPTRDLHIALPTKRPQKENKACTNRHQQPACNLQCTSARIPSHLIPSHPRTKPSPRGGAAPDVGVRKPVKLRSRSGFPQRPRNPHTRGRLGRGVSEASPCPSPPPLQATLPYRPLRTTPSREETHQPTKKPTMCNPKTGEQDIDIPS